MCCTLARLSMFEVVVIGVVEIEAIGDCDVDAGGFVVEVDGEVGRVGQQLVDCCHHRVGDGACATLRPVADDAGVRVTGLEHHRGTAHAAGFEVDDAAHLDAVFCF
jgi:hypothetical protein